MSTTWRLSNRKMTVRVETDSNRKIVDAAPVIRRFIGQHLNNLVRWMQRVSVVEMQAIKPMGDNDECDLETV